MRVLSVPFPMNILTVPSASAIRATIRRHAYPLILAVGTLLLFVLALWATRFVENSADNASIILEGQAMFHHQLFLHGWFLPPDSFITTEIPLYGIISLFVPTSWLLKMVPALLFTLMILGAVVIAGERAAPADRWRSMGTCLALLAFPIGLVLRSVLQGPEHIATICLCLVAFIAYDRFAHQRSPGRWLLIFGLVTTWNIIGDPLAEVLVSVPVSVVSVLAVWKGRGKEVAAWQLLGAAVGSLAAGLLLRTALIASGTNLGPADLKLTNSADFAQHVWWALTGILMFFQIDVTRGLAFGPGLLIALIHLGVILLLVAGLVRFSWQRLLAGNLRDSLDTVLLWAIIGDVSVYLLSTFPLDLWSIRYLVPAFVFAAILAYHVMAPFVTPRWLRTGVFALLAVNILTFGGTLATRPAAAVPEQTVIAFLLDHHLTNGLGSFWSSADITVQSNAQVHVHQIIVVNDKIRAYLWHANTDWFRQSGLQQANFLIYGENDSATVYYQAAVHSFGSPDHQYTVQHEIILVWDQPMIDETYGII